MVRVAGVAILSLAAAAGAGNSPDRGSASATVRAGGQDDPARDARAPGPGTRWSQAVGLPAEPLDAATTGVEILLGESAIPLVDRVDLGSAAFLGIRDLDMDAYHVWHGGAGGGFGPVVGNPDVSLANR